MFNPFKRRQTPDAPQASDKPRENAAALRAARELELRAEALDHCESAFNARVASFEALMRRQAEDALANAGAGADAEHADELARIADALEAREKKIAELAANLREREVALERKTRALQVREEELDRKRAENERFSLRLAAAQEEFDAQERLFDERSRQTLETIRRQKEELCRLGKAA